MCNIYKSNTAFERKIDVNIEIFGLLPPFLPTFLCHVVSYYCCNMVDFLIVAITKDYLILTSALMYLCLFNPIKTQECSNVSSDHQYKQCHPHCTVLNTLQKHVSPDKL